MAIKRHCEKRHGVERFCLFGFGMEPGDNIVGFLKKKIICFDFVRIDFICYQY